MTRRDRRSWVRWRASSTVSTASNGPAPWARYIASSRRWSCALSGGRGRAGHRTAHSWRGQGDRHAPGRDSVTTVGWLSCSQADVQEGDDWLSPREQATLAALRLERRRMDWRLGRWTAKHAVRASLGTCAPGALDAVEIIAAPDGAPEAFVTGRVAPLALSLSHRDDVAVCAVAPSKTAIGCDIEAIEARVMPSSRIGSPRRASGRAGMAALVAGAGHHARLVREGERPEGVA